MFDTSKIDALFDELVPFQGKADSLAGEWVRAVCRIGHRFFNDGDMVGREDGLETCNPAARFLIATAPESVGTMAAALWYIEDEDAYEAVLEELSGRVVSAIEAAPELKRQPTPDMFDYKDPVEDVWSWDEEDEEEEEVEDFDDEEWGY